jgi:hypothetical protein
VCRSTMGTATPSLHCREQGQDASCKSTRDIGLMCTRSGAAERRQQAWDLCGAAARTPLMVLPGT